MLRMIFTVASTLALLLAGSVWLAAQPSGGEVREVVVPVLKRGLALAASASRRLATAAGSELRRATDDEAARVPLTPTASGVWEPDPEAPPTEPRPQPPPAAEEPPGLPDPQPEPVDEVVLATAAPFIDSPEAGEADVARPAPAEEDAGPPPDQDEWAALIRRMLVVHGRVSTVR